MSECMDSLLDAQRRAECDRNDEAMNAGRSIVPYKAGKVQVGLQYIPRPQRIEGDAAAIQRALLDPRTAEPASLPRRFLGFLWGWC